MKQFGIPVVVAVNRFATDTQAEIEALREAATAAGVPSAVCQHFDKGGAGAEDLAIEVVRLCEESSDFTYLYGDDLPLWTKIETICRRIYRAARAEAPPSVRAQLERWQDDHGHLPICMAKTQYSFSSDPALLGAPTDFVIPIREVRLAAGAGFVIAICGEIMTMPGLPSDPAAKRICLDENGDVEGLF